jgi:hypothetical protein
VLLMDGEAMVGFGYKQGWLAVAATDTSPVLTALGLHDLGPTSWRAGIDLAYLTEDRLAVTPPLSGAGGRDWVLVVGRELMLAEPVDLVGLSVRLHSEAQLFQTHRVVEAHRWERAVDGRLVRAFEYIGEQGRVPTWLGDPDEVERSIGLPAALVDEVDIFVGELDVMRVAAAWSIDPSDLDGRPAPGPLRVAVMP